MQTSRRLALVVLATVAVAAGAGARAEVHVSGEVPVTLADQVLVDAMSWKALPIARLSPSRPVRASMEFVGGTGTLSAYIVDEANLNFFRQKLPFRAYRAERQLSPITLEGAAWSHGQYYLLLDNQNAVLLARQVAYRIDYIEKVNPDAQRELKKLFEDAYAALKADFVFPDFNIHVVPCGQPNAFSAPDITLCTELVTELAGKGRESALVGIFLHELGHTLLNIWGMPGYDNEDIADEFAAVVLLNGSDEADFGGQALSDMITWFSEQDSKAQARAMLAHGDRHAPSIQRVRNLERILAEPAPVIARWNKLLYRQMTPAALERIVSKPEAHDDPRLAREILGLKGTITPTKVATVVPAKPALPADCVMEGKAVDVTGFVSRETFPGRPNYESIEKDDEPETVWIVTTEQPINVCGQSPETQEPYSVGSVRRFQLVLQPEEYKLYRSAVYKSARVQGQLFVAHTAHHHTDVLIDVEKLEQRP